jgi:phospholipase/carboxylesterase
MPTSRLQARPHPDPSAAPPAERGLLSLGLGDRRDGLLYVPTRHPLLGPRPLMVACHGAGSQASHSVRPFIDAAEKYGLLLLACDSRGSTWDAVRGSFGPDVTFLDRALEQVFQNHWIDTSHIILDGFSDGATYALSLGLANSDLFTHLMAFSPGFVTGDLRVGRPRIFISHGTTDAVLPFGRCGQPIASGLLQAGYDVSFLPFAGGHTVPAEVQQAAFDWLGLEG